MPNAITHSNASPPIISGAYFAGPGKIAIRPQPSPSLRYGTIVTQTIISSAKGCIGSVCQL
jgi:hypothetical protein